MRNLDACMLLVASMIASSAFAQKQGDGYPYDRSRTGCVEGDCTSGFGVYLFENDDYYAGEFTQGMQHGQGRHVFVDRGPWSNARILYGQWVDGRIHGRATQVYPNGNREGLLWYRGENVTAQVEKCRTATTVSNTYKGFVAVLNGLAAAARGDNILEGAAAGYDAAEDQIGPKAVDLTCDQLLNFFD